MNAPPSGVAHANPAHDSALNKVAEQVGHAVGTAERLFRAAIGQGVSPMATDLAAFAARALGGGDIKLFAAIGLWMSFWGAVWLLAAVLMAGGLLAVIFILTRLLRCRSTRTRIPYGLAIAAGACFVFATQLGIVGAEKPKPFVVRPFIK